VLISIHLHSLTLFTPWVIGWCNSTSYLKTSGMERSGTKWPLCNRVSLQSSV